MTILTMTGHRDIDDPIRFQSNMIMALQTPGVTALIQGLAHGADLEAANIAIQLGVPVISAMPWTGDKPNKEDVELYRFVLQHSDEVYPVVESESYPGAWCYHERNRWMVKEGDEVIAWWNEYPKGGTAETVKFANKLGKRVTNLYLNERLYRA